MAFVPDKPADVPAPAVPAAPAGARFVPDVPTPAAAPAPTPEVRPWAKALEEGIQGAGEAATSLATGIPASLIGGLAVPYKGIVGGKYGTPEGAEEARQYGEKVAEKLTYAPRTEKGQEYVQNVADFARESGMAGLPLIGGEMAALGSVPAGVARATASQAAKSVAGRVAPAAQKAASYVIPKPNAQTIALARKANELGIPLRPDMLTDNRLVNMLGETLEKVPLAGAKTEQRRVAFNQAIMRQIGADPKATKLTPDVFDKAISSSGQKIGDISARATVPLDTAFISAIDSHVADASKFETADVAKVVNNYADELRAKAVNGVIPGEAFRKLNTKIGGQIRTTTNGDLKHALSLFQEDMHDALSRNLSPADRVALSAARKQYANAKTLEPLVAKSTEGDISPAGLMGAISATKSQKSALARGRGGELSDIAKVGQRFLKEQPTSGTAERGLIYSLLGGGAGAGAVGDPALAAALYGGTYGVANLYNRLGPALTRKLIK